MMEITCELLMCEVADGITTLADVIAMADVIAILCHTLILQTPSNVGVLVGIIFSHTPDEAKSGGLAKACVQ